MCVFFSEVLSSYDDLDSDVIKNYSEFSLASLLYYGMKEGACSEQSSRMTAMDSASKNAGKQMQLLGQQNFCGGHSDVVLYT